MTVDEVIQSVERDHEGSIFPRWPTNVLILIKEIERLRELVDYYSIALNRLES